MSYPGLYFESSPLNNPFLQKEPPGIKGFFISAFNLPNKFF